MEQTRHLWFSFSVLLLFILFSSSPRSAEAYKNHTVGDSFGWFDTLEKPGVDYQKWADSKKFSLGDFLVFNTDSNHSVVQTYDSTSYKQCDYNNAPENATTEWSGADPSATSPTPVWVAVPLVRQGTNYFFSGNYDGEQCKFGQRFQVNVSHGQGLPPSLKPPGSQDSDRTAEAPGPGGSGSRSDGEDEDDEESAPDTIVPASFDHPKEVKSDEDEGKGKDGSGAGSILTGNFLSWVGLVLLGWFAF